MSKYFCIIVFNVMWVTDGKKKMQSPKYFQKIWLSCYWFATVDVEIIYVKFH
jgi:hypothetical protein